MGNIKNRYLVFESNFIAIVKYAGTFKELKKQGHKAVWSFYTDNTILHEIVEIWHFSLKKATNSERKYKVGYISYFDKSSRSNLSKIRYDYQKNFFEALFTWSVDNLI